AATLDKSGKSPKAERKRNERTRGHKKGRPKSPFFLPLENQDLALVLHLGTDQITNGGRTSAFGFLLVAQVVHGVLLVLNVLGLDGQADDAGLAVDADDLGFDFVAFLQHVASVFDAVTADFGSLQSRLDVVAQIDDGALGVNFLHGATHDGALVVQRHVVAERIIFQLLDAQGDALALRIDRQDDGFQLVALLEAANG